MCVLPGHGEVRWTRHHEADLQDEEMYSGVYAVWERELERWIDLTHSFPKPYSQLPLPFTHTNICFLNTYIQSSSLLYGVSLLSLFLFHILFQASLHHSYYKLPFTFSFPFLLFLLFLSPYCSLPLILINYLTTTLCSDTLSPPSTTAHASCGSRLLRVSA